MPTSSGLNNMQLKQQLIEMLRSPRMGEDLHQEGQWLVTVSGAERYFVNESGIPLFAQEYCSEDGKIQQAHYDKVADAYITNLSYPHTQEYMDYLDRAFESDLSGAELDQVAEICCGRGEALRLLGDRVRRGVGVDISQSMLEVAVKELPGHCAFLQADATMLPLKDEQFDTVFMFGGIHHVNDRERLFSEIFRVLKKGGRFYWREPVSDFLLWRILRTIIYKLSSSLDYDTERPLLYRETVPVLEKVGFTLKSWKTYGFLGFCFFMNSDVLVFNRLFRFIPGIRAVTKLAAKFDDLVLRLPGLNRSGLQVIGMAEKGHSSQQSDAAPARSFRP